MSPECALSSLFEYFAPLSGRGNQAFMSNPRSMRDKECRSTVLKSMRTIGEMKGLRIGERTEIFDNVVVKGADKCIKINLTHQSSTGEPAI
jgi:hypothetical protein